MRGVSLPVACDRNALLDRAGARIRPSRDHGAGGVVERTEPQLVRQYGPEIGTHGGMASMLDAYSRLPLRRYRFRFVTTWSPDAALWGAAPFARALGGLARGRTWRTAIAHVHLSVRGSFVREGAIATAAANLGAPVVVSLHGGEMGAFVARHDRLARAVLGQADAIVALGPESRAAVRRFLRSETRLVEIPNPIELPTDPDPAGSASEQVLFAGEQRSLKGLDVLLAAWPQVQAARPKARLVVVGRAGDVEPAPIAGVDWRGPVARAEVGRLLLESRVAALPSRAEVMPMFLLEAMAAARPVVTTPVGEVESLVGDDGTLVPVGEPGPLAEALTGFLADRDGATAVGARLRARVEQRFAPERVAAQLEALYDTLR